MGDDEHVSGHNASSPLPPLSSKVHLSILGSVGGTTLALQYSRRIIQSGGRVLWACTQMPDSTRFQQLFAEIDIVASSRFHALQIGDNISSIPMQISNAKNSLPRVELIVIDEWTPSKGQAPRENIEMAQEILELGSDNCSVLILSKSYEAQDSAINGPVARGGGKFSEVGAKLWHLTRQRDGNVRHLKTDDELHVLIIENDGFRKRP